MDSFDIAKFSNGYAGCPAFLNQGKPLFGAKFISCHVFCNKGKWGFYALQDGVGRMLTVLPSLFAYHQLVFAFFSLFKRGYKCKT